MKNNWKWASSEWIQALIERIDWFAGDLPAFTPLMLYKCDLHVVQGHHSLLNFDHLRKIKLKIGCLFSPGRISQIQSWSENYPDLQCNVALKGGPALQMLISTAARAPLQWDTSRHVGIFHFSRVLQLHIHQLLHGLTHGLCPHLFEPHHWVTNSVLTL